ncbi:peroxisomal membrane protein 11C-like [Anneissia japonica]|uniref:peroxisomal membrane protein 11C-like n=1 Tax=Anneissia japonica TaxID=1529436 RepID=UPI0014259B96|nr:peroxisomal membrane protein 11C-like [Anneissia japonica]
MESTSKSRYIKLALKLLESYRGRDNIIRISSYVTMLLSSFGKQGGPMNVHFGVITQQLNLCRTILRLFDDLPMLAATATYGFGKHEKVLGVGLLKAFENLAYQIFFPVEHVAWLAHAKVLKGYNEGKWMAGCIALWAVALTLAITRNIISLRAMRKTTQEVQKQITIEGGFEDSSLEVKSTSLTKSVQELKLNEYNMRLDLLKNIADLCNAVNWLPPGFLWSGKIPTSITAMCGILSSYLGIYQTATKMVSDKKTV